jgi:streptogramin lyase
MPGKRALSGVVAVAATACVLIVAPAASGFIYWADTMNQTIGRANNDGSAVNDAFIHTGELPFAVAVDSAHVYWVNQKSNSIGRANIDGSGVNNSFITGIAEPDGIAVNGSWIFWSTIPGPIGRANLDGSEPKPKLITAASEPCGLALDSGHVYWANDSIAPAHIGRAGLDGSFPQPEYVSVEAFPCGVAVNSANVYWADTGFFGGGSKIGRADVATGKSVDPNFIAGASTPCGVALDNSSHLYWANVETGTIGRANSDGTAVNQSFVATGANQPCGVAVDSLASQPPINPTPTPDVTPPQTTIIKGPGGKLGEGVAKFRFRSSEAGSHFACRLDRGKTRGCKSPRTYRGLKPGRHLFRVWATDATGNKDPTPAKRRFKVPGSAR